MTILQALVKLRDDIKTWTSNNIKALNNKIETNKTDILDRVEANSVSTQQKFNEIQDRITIQEENLATIPIQEDYSGEMIVVDEDGNIAMKVSSKGLEAGKVFAAGLDLGSKVSSLDLDLDRHTDNTTIHVTQADKDLWNDRDFHSLENAPNIQDDESGEVVVADDNGNVIMRVDKDGVRTTAVAANTLTLGSVNVNDKIDSYDIAVSKLSNHLDNTTIHVTEKDKELWNDRDFHSLENAPAIDDDGSGQLTFTDSNGNTIARLDASSFETTTIAAKDDVVVGGASLVDHFNNTHVHITDSERDYWNAKPTTEDMKQAISDLVDSAPGTLDTLNELAAALGDDPNFATTVTNLIAQNKDIAADALNAHASNTSNPHKVTKDQVGLSEVDNTSDEDKPVSTAQQTALDNLEKQLSEGVTSESDEWKVTDGSGNTITAIDSNGLSTTNVTAKDDVVVNGNSVNEHINDSDIHIIATERDYWNAKPTMNEMNTAISTAVTSLVDNAPDSLNTLNELAAALGDDPNFATTVTNLIEDNREAAADALKAHTSDTDNPHKVTKAQVGLGNADNTSDEDKPVSTAQQAALDSLEKQLSEEIVSEKNEWRIIDSSGNIIATIDSNGLVTTAAALKDDVTINGSSVLSHLENANIHVTTNDKDYWNAKPTVADMENAINNLVGAAPGALNTLEELAAALGEDANFATTITDLIAQNKQTMQDNLDAHTTNTSNPHDVKKSQVGLGNVDNTSDMNKPVSTAQQAALDALESQLSEEIVSEKSEWKIVDSNGNIVATIDSKGLTTTNVTATKGLYASAATTNTVAIIDGNGMITSSISADLLQYLKNVTKDLNNWINSKQDTITGAASTITSSVLTTNRALVSNSSGKVAASDITTTELNYLDGVTSNVQTQLDSKSNTGHTHYYAGSDSIGGPANRIPVRTSSYTSTTAGEIWIVT